MQSLKLRLARLLGRDPGRLAAPVSPSAEPEGRILVPIANPETARSLVELALALRRRASVDEILAATVVRPSANSAPARVAAAEYLLASATEVAQAAGVRATATTRIDPDVSRALTQLAVETRASRIVLGWNGQRSLGSRMFGSVIDRVVARASAEVLVVRLMAPLSGIRRVALVVPDNHPEVAAALQTGQQLAQALEVPLWLRVVGPRAEETAQAIARLAPRLGTTALTVPDWKALEWLLDSTDDPSTLTVLSGVRKGSQAWQAPLEKLPGFLASRPGRSFAVAYGGQAPLAALPDTEPQYRAFPIEATSTREAIHSLLMRSCEAIGYGPLEAAPLAREAQVAVMNSQAIADLHVADWPEVTVAVGVCEREIRDPRCGWPIRQVQLKVSPYMPPSDPPKD